MLTKLAEKWGKRQIEETDSCKCDQGGWKKWKKATTKDDF